jgi:PTS system nitrogen regulatory IIA component
MDAESAGPVAALLRRGGVLRDVPGADRDAVLAAAVARMPLPEGADRDRLLAEILQREALASTALGGGLAVPHPLDAACLRLPEAWLTLVFPAAPVPYEAPDGQPVAAFFVLLAPNAGLHLRVLAHLGRLLQAEEARAVLARRAPDAEIFDVLARAESAR